LLAILPNQTLFYLSPLVERTVNCSNSGKIIPCHVIIEIVAYPERTTKGTGGINIVSFFRTVFLIIGELFALFRADLFIFSGSISWRVIWGG
jgi:hypothetical protein